MAPPDKLDKAPSLGTMAGFGRGLYGKRDTSEDGSHVKTLALSALYIPIIPLSAFRVVDHGDGNYDFLAKVGLSPAARVYRYAVVVAVIVLIGGFALNRYLQSPNRLAGAEISAADRLLDAGKTEEALAAYEQVLDRWSFKADGAIVERVGKKVLEIRLARVGAPFGENELDEAVRFTRYFARLPLAAQTKANQQFVATRVLRWVEGESDAPPNRLLVLLDAALRLNLGDYQDRVAQARIALVNELAASLVAKSPVDALAMLAELDAVDRDTSTAIAASIKDQPSLLREASASLAALGLDSPELTAAIAATRDRARVALLASGDRGELARAVAKAPRDQELAVALAQIETAAGRADLAERRLAKLAARGPLTGRAQVAFAGALAAGQRLEAASSVLRELLDRRIGALRRREREYRDAKTELRAALRLRANRGDAPREVIEALRSGDAVEVRTAFADWFATEAARSVELGELRAAAARLSYLVDASIELGKLELALAERATGAAKRLHLTAARGAFEAIELEAAGLVGYHIGLGQVLHRLGMTDAGEREFDRLLEREDAKTSLAVARAYREIGNIARARSLAEDVFKGSTSGDRIESALLMSSLVTDLAEREIWLSRAAESSPRVQVKLTELKAKRAALGGRNSEAVRLWRRVASHYLGQAAHDAFAANNASVAHFEIYQLTGDRGELAAARAGLEFALTIEPDSSVIVANLAAHGEFEGWLAVLSKLIDVDALRLSRGDVDRLATVLTAGPRGRELRALAARDPIARSARRLAERATALAPNSVENWRRRIRWSWRLRDEGDLRASAERLKSDIPDAGALTRERAQWLSGALDEMVTLRRQRERRRLEEMVAATKGAPKPTASAARYLLAAHRAEVAVGSNRARDIETAFKELAAVETAWAALGDVATPTAIAWVVAEASERDPVVGQLRDRRWRELSPTLMLADALLSSDSDALRASLAKAPALAIAARRLASSGEPWPAALWVVGELTGNKGLLERAREAFEQPTETQHALARLRADPSSKSGAVLKRLFEPAD